MSELTLGILLVVIGTLVVIFCLREKIMDKYMAVSFYTTIVGCFIALAGVLLLLPHC